MKQVLWNLCNNALRAMPEGGLLAVGLESGPEVVKISIQDTGVGMDPGTSTRIFEPFQSGFAGGTGLGLAIVYQIIQAHQGRIHVETGKGHGSGIRCRACRAPCGRQRPCARRVPDMAPEVAHPVGKG